MNTKIYKKLVALAKEILQNLKCTDKNICLSAREISTFFEHKKKGTKNIYTWGVWFDLPNLQKKYTITVDSFTCSFDPEKYFTLLYKFEQLTNTPLKERFSFSFGDGSERKEKVYTLYYDETKGRTIAKKQLLHLLNNKVAIRAIGTAAKVFIYVPGAVFDWYEIMTFSDYKKKIEYYNEYLTTNYYSIVLSHLQRWQSCEGNKYNDIYLRLQEQLKANQVVSTNTATAATIGSDGSQPETAATHDSSTNTATTAATGSDGSQAETAATHDSSTNTATAATIGSDGSQAETAATHDSSTNTATAATIGSDGGQAAPPTAAPPRIEAKQEPPTPPPTPKPTAAARGAPYIYFYAIS